MNTQQNGFFFCYLRFIVEVWVYFFVGFFLCSYMFIWLLTENRKKRAKVNTEMYINKTLRQYTGTFIVLSWLHISLAWKTPQMIGVFITNHDTKSIYENEQNNMCRVRFRGKCLRWGFNVTNMKTEWTYQVWLISLMYV